MSAMLAAISRRRPRATIGRPTGRPAGRNLHPPAAAAHPPVPTSPPPGYYDPSIDSQVGASNRGLGDLLGDVQTARTRGQSDLLLNTAQITRARDNALADLMTRQTQLTEDHTTAIQGLQRNYARLGANQAQGFAVGGVGAGGGAFAQALAKRTTNESIDQAPIDTNFNRGMSDIATQRQRTTDAADTQLGQLNLNWGRQNEDWQTQTDRATRENTAFGQDANQQGWFQARQLGYTPPPPPPAPRGRGKGTGSRRRGGH